MKRASSRSKRHPLHYQALILIFILGSLALPHPAFAHTTVSNLDRPAPAACRQAAEASDKSLLVVLLDRSGILIEGSAPTDRKGYITSVTKALSDLWPEDMAVIPFSGTKLLLPILDPATLSDPTQRADLKQKNRGLPFLNPGNQAATNQIVMPALVRENTSMATGALATWAQMLWEGTDTELRQALDRKGILAKLEENNRDAVAVMRRLYTHTMLFGRSDNESGQSFLLLSPSPESGDFRRDLSIPSRLIIVFLDPERLLLFYTQRYVREPLFIAEPEPTPAMLSVSPHAFTFNATTGIVSQSVISDSMGKEPFSWTAELEAGAPSCISLEIPANLNQAGEAETSFNVNFDATGLASGLTFTTGMVVHAFDPQSGEPATGSSVSMSITANVVSPTIQLSVTAMDFTATPGNPPPVQYPDP